MTRDQPRIVVVGSLVMDFVARAERLPRRGETVLGEAFGMFPGGKGANQAVQAARLGAEVFLVGRVGDDYFGEQLLASLHESGVKTDFVCKDASVKTAACCIHVDRQGGNAIVIVPEANQACGPADVDAARELIRSADVLLCQLEIPLPTVAHAVRVAAECGVQVMVNPAPAQSLPPDVLTRTTCFTPNETETEFYAGITPDTPAKVSSAARGLLALGPQQVILTLGERGAHFAEAEQEFLVPAYRIEPVDATAAGDAFNGALAVAVAEGKDMKEAIAFANAAGAVCATRVGAQPSLGWRNEIEALMKGAR